MRYDLLWTIFVVLSFAQFVTERILAFLNKRYYENSRHAEKACQELGWKHELYLKCLSYSRDKYRFSSIVTSIEFVVTLSFLYFGGLGWVENTAQGITGQLGYSSSIFTGLAFFAVFSLLSSVFGLGFELYSTFVIEQKHGFNRQSIGQFFSDKLKGMLLGTILGGLFLSGLLYVIENLGEFWWVWAWGFVSSFMLIMLWLYPSVLAPIFNRFDPLPDGELKQQILDLSAKVEFQAAGISVMDASKRSGHGNAFFTGVFGAKKIVLFDTLLEQLTTAQTTAVMAHELGHFKCNHVRNRMMRGFLIYAVLFWGLSVALPFEAFYQALGLKGASAYGALIVFPMWWSLVGFWLTPLSSMFSRKDEYEADAFALKHTSDVKTLSHALIQLSEENKSMPIAHPWYSGFYFSHPTVLERIQAMMHPK